MNCERHYLVVKIVANCSDGHCSLLQFSLPDSDVYYIFIVYCIAIKSIHSKHVH